MTTPTAPLVRHGYRCECRVQSPSTGSAPALVDTFDTTSAAQGVRWVRRSLTILLLAVDSVARERLAHWIDADHEKALADLVSGRPFNLGAEYADVRVEWTARPVVFLPLLPPPHTPIISYKLLCTGAQRRTELE
ncbi:hypothetical protein [Streptacidiphilus sp. EB129]|uniref:hypothetical protein n=1 Tax=Streptacidiphilus sp. EB129 TaxID=3156262 RepID=UPI003511D7D9